MRDVSLPVNELVLAHAPGSPERAQLDHELARQSSTPRELPLVIGGERVHTLRGQEFSAPHRHALALGRYSLAEPGHVERAIDAALSAKSAWAARALGERAAFFERAADLLSGPWRARLLAAT